MREKPDSFIAAVNEVITQNDLFDGHPTGQNLRFSHIALIETFRCVLCRKILQSSH